MTLASDIIRRAYREGNFIAVGASPASEEQAEGLDLLQSIVDTLFPVTVGTGLKPWYVPQPQKTANTAANYPALAGDTGLPPVYDVTLPPPNSRLMMKNTAAKTIYFQYQPQDGALMEYVDVNHTADVTLDGNGAMFGLTGTDTQVTIPEDPSGRNETRKWVYRADYGAWVEIETLALTTDLPFPSEFDEYFVTELAMRLTPANGNDPRQITVTRNREMRVYIRDLYVQMYEVWFDDAGGRTEQTYRNNGGSYDFLTGR